LTIPAFGDDGSLELGDGRRWQMYKRHWLGTAYELKEGRTVHGTADRQSWLGRDLEVIFDGQVLALQRPGFWSRDWQLVDASGAKLVEIQPRGIFRQGAYLTVRSPVEAQLVTFAYYLAYRQQQEEAAATAAATSAS
jgi:hypothetical protein